MGWNKRQEALDYLRAKKAYHLIMSGARYSERGSGHFAKYMTLCHMLGEVPEKNVVEIYGEQNADHGRNRKQPRRGTDSSLAGTASCDN